MGGTISTLVDKFCDNDNHSCYRQTKATSLKKTHKSCKKSNICDLTEKNLNKDQKKHKNKTYLTTDDIEEINSQKIFNAKEEYFMTYLDKQCGCNHKPIHNTDDNINNDSESSIIEHKPSQPKKHNNEIVELSITNGDVSLLVRILPNDIIIDTDTSGLYNYI